MLFSSLSDIHSIDSVFNNLQVSILLQCMSLYRALHYALEVQVHALLVGRVSAYEIKLSNLTQIPG